MGDLLDTMVISDPRKPRPAPGVQAYFERRDLREMFISTVTLAEIEYGIHVESSPAKWDSLEQWLGYRIRPTFADRTLQVTEPILVRWRMLMASGRRRNHTFPQPDLLLAATALEHNLTLITRNTRDFADIPGLQLLNPWEKIA